MSHLTEHDFQRALHRIVDETDVPLDRIVSGALDRGRRLRRRRTARLVSMVGTLAGLSVAAAVVAGSAVTGTAGGAGVDPATQPTDTQVPMTHQFGVTADETAQTLESLLPAGSTTGLTNTNYSASSASDSSSHTIMVDGGGMLKSMVSGHAAPYRAAQLIFDDGHGPARVEVMIQAPEPGGKPSLASVDVGSALCRQPGINCSSVQGGTLITESNIPEYAAGSHTANAAGNQVTSSTAVYESAGWAITVTAYNATSDKGGTVTRTTPPLSSARLGEIATYPGWLK